MRLATSLALAVLLLLTGCQDTPPRDKLLRPGETVAYVTEYGRIYLDGLLVAEPGDRALRAFATEVTRLHRDSLRKGRKFEILLRAEKAADPGRYPCASKSWTPDRERLRICQTGRPPPR